MLPHLVDFFSPSSCFQCQWQQKKTACYSRTRSPKYPSHTCFTRTWVFLNTCCCFFFYPKFKNTPVAVHVNDKREREATRLTSDRQPSPCVTGNDNSAAVMAKHKERSQGEKAGCRLLTSVWMCVQITAGKIK